MGPKRRAQTWTGGLAACLLSLVVSASALAAPPEGEHERAVESFRRGTQLVEAGQLQAAIDAFREALRHEPTSVGARLDLADCYEKIGSPASAWREYAIAEAHARRANDSRREMARSSGAHLQTSLLLVTLTGERARGLEVRLDGDPIAAEILERGSLAVAPGRHRVVLSAPDKKPVALDVSGAAGETRAVAIAFDDERVPSPLPPRANGSSERRTWAIALGAVGLGGIVLGSIAGAVALGDKSNLDREAHDPTVGPTRFYADRSTADTFASVSTGAFVVGGTALAAGVSLYVLARSSRPTALRAAIGPIAGGSTGVLVAGTF
jgi:hypothetical protein